jgi:CelD/BcsL family acetyltransferase involved in cellulose biosynthesis
LIDIDCDWQSYLASRSSNHVKNLRKARKRLESHGQIDFHRFRIDDEDQAEQLLHRALEIESRSWKAIGGTPTLKHPIALSFFTQQARQLAAWDALEISLLELDGRPIAFEYGYRGKGVHLAHKSGYDDAFSDASPGHLLMAELLKTFHDDPGVQLVDCLGPLSVAMSRWATCISREGRLLLAPSGLLTRAAWWAYRCATSIRKGSFRHSHMLPQSPAASESLSDTFAGCP